MLITKVLGLLRDTMIISNLGLGVENDAYKIGIPMTVNLFLGVGSAMSTNLIPKVVRHGNSKDGQDFLNKVMSWVLLTMAVFIGIYYFIIPSAVTYIFAPGYDGEKLQLTITVARIMIPAIFFICMTYFMQGILQANEKFMMPALMSLPSNLVFFAYIFIGMDQFGVIGLAVITTVAWSAQCIFLAIPVIKNKLIPFRWHLSFRDKEVSAFFLALIPIAIVTLTHTFNIMYDNSRATFIGDGFVAAIDAGNILFRAIVQTTVYGITAVMFPKFNRRYVEANDEGLNQSVVNVLRSVFLLLLPMSVGLITLGDDLISFIFERGLFDESDVVVTTVAFTGYTALMIAFGTVDVLNKAYYTVGNRRVPLMITGIITVSNIILTPLLSENLGFQGIPIGTAAAYFIGAIVSLVIFMRKSKREATARLAGTFIKSAIAAFIMGIIVVLLKNVFIIDTASITSALYFGIIILAGALIYGFVLLLIREDLVYFNVVKAMEKLKK